MIASIVILMVSALLFVYWFRYTCLLILGAKSSRDYAARIAEANQLSFLAVRDQLARPGADLNLEALQVSLARDFRVLLYLVGHSIEFQSGTQSIERTMLKIDYYIMNCRYQLLRLSGSRRSIDALREMVQIVDYLADTMGERMAGTEA